VVYNEQLAERIGTILEGRPEVSERKMFGGLAFMVNGNMCCGIVRDELMVRVGPDGHDEALAQPHAKPMDFTGRPMKGMVYVEPDGVRGDADLKAWVERGYAFAGSLPPKR
jgi:TfoX/Sxy family transcriptional regulator of competence genes